jgi:hypothetical protein
VNSDITGLTNSMTSIFPLIFMGLKSTSGMMAVETAVKLMPIPAQIVNWKMNLSLEGEVKSPIRSSLSSILCLHTIKGTCIFGYSKISKTILNC